MDRMPSTSPYADSELAWRSVCVVLAKDLIGAGASWEVKSMFCSVRR